MNHIYSTNMFTPRYDRLTMASSLGMLGRTPARDEWFTPQCVELKLIVFRSSAALCPKMTLDTHSDKRISWMWKPPN